MNFHILEFNIKFNFTSSQLEEELISATGKFSWEFYLFFD